MPKTFPLVVVVSMLAAAAGSAVAQAGRAPTGTWSDPTQSMGNLTVTGQVSGGFAFRGTVPYAGANELRLQLPSETIDNFQRDAMSLQRVQRGALYGPQPYTPPSRATYMLRRASQSSYAFDPITGSVEAGGAAGVVIPRPQPSTVIQDYAFTSVLSQEDLARVVSRSDTSRMAPASEAPLSAVVTVDQSRPGTSALFGMIQETQRRRLAETMLDLETLGDEDVEPSETDTGDDDDAPSDGSGRPQNAFADLLARLARSDDAAGRPNVRPGAAPSSGSLEQLDTDPSARVQVRRAAGSLAGALGQSVVVRDLAGTSGGLFNRYMTQGDDLLRAGRFYQAASAYSRAQIIHEFNPLAALGAGLAYLGAGESHRASFQLRRSIRLFPELARVRVDVDGLVGADVIDRRLAEIRDQLGETVEPGEMPQVFMLTFLHANRGDLEAARRWAAELAPLAEGDPRLSDYAEAIRGPAPADDEPDNVTEAP